MPQYRHILTDFKDLRKVIGEVTKTQPAKTRYQQQAEKMNYRQQKEVQGPMNPSKVRVGGSGITYPYDLKDIGKQINPFDIYIKKPGAKKANLELQKALQKALKQKSFAPARLIMQRVQNKYRQLGADDTEPNAIITDILNQVFGTTRGSRESNLPEGQFWGKAGDAMSKAHIAKLKKAGAVMLQKKEKGGTSRITLPKGHKDIAKYKKQGYKEIPIESVEINEGGFKDIAIAIDQGDTPQKIAKKYKLDLKYVKQIFKDYEKVMNHVDDLLKKTENAPMKEGKYLKYSDLLLQKSRLIDKEGPNSPTVKVINKKIDQEMKKLGINENIGKLQGSGQLSVISKMVDKGWNVQKIGKELALPPKAVEEIKKYIDDINNPNSAINSKYSKATQGESRSQKVKEEYEHAKQSPFKLKSEQVPRAIAITGDGFGKRHATVEDIITACDTFGMIIDKELQVEQIQKQLGKKGFISYNKSELEDVFEERETERMILTLESDLEEQTPTEYTQGEIAYAQLHEHDIEFLKPDGIKSVGPILKMSGKTYNVKDKFTGKSFTYKYSNKLEENKVDYEKSWTQPGDGFLSFKELSEVSFSSSLVKKAVKVATSMAGNMTGAYKKIEKMKKGLADDPAVQDALRAANEDVNVDEWISKNGTRRRVKERDQRKNKKIIVQKVESISDNSLKWMPEGGDKEAYQKFFNSVLKKFNVNSPAELEGDKKKEFFDYIDKNWKGDHEEVEPDIHKSYKMDGRRTNFREKMKKLGYVKGK